MEFSKVTANAFSIPTLKTLIGNSSISLEELVQSKSSLNAKVLEILKGNNLYLLEIAGKQVKLQSEAKLLANENLELNVKRMGNRIHLEIMNRSSSISEAFIQENVWSKNYFSPMKLIHKTFEQAQAEVSIQKVIHLLDVFFPGLEWQRETQDFEWSFSEGEANGFFGRSQDSFGFYLHFASKVLGSADSYFHWKSDDLSDLVLHTVFDTLSSYLYANENLSELKKMLSSNSVFPNNIVFHYSSVNGKGNWVA